MTTFTGFSEEDLRRIKSADIDKRNESAQAPATLQLTTPIKKIEKIGLKVRPTKPQYKIELKSQTSDEVIDNITFEKCRLSLKPNSPEANNNDQENNNTVVNDDEAIDVDINMDGTNFKNNHEDVDSNCSDAHINYINNEVTTENRRASETTPDIVRGVTDYTEDDLAAHKIKLEELQLKQKLMEEQNKKRKEMLAKALADRTKQTVEEVQRLEKIKKELQVLDGQFTTDVSMLRKKIDQACLTYAEAEKHYLKVEKEFLQAKINLQKEKEKKELLTEHLCALITHNETRKAQKLETLMYQLVDEKKVDDNEVKSRALTPDDEKPVIVDGVDVRTGKMVDITNS